VRGLVAFVLLALFAGEPAMVSAQPDAAPVTGDAAARAQAEAQAEALYEQGLRFWRQGDPVGAWLILRGIPPETRAGRLASEQLGRANAIYEEGLDRLAEGQDSLARQAFVRGLANGPIDPHHYLELADIYRNRGLRERAVAWYGRYLAFVNRSGERPQTEVLDDIVSYIGGGTGAELTDIEAEATPRWLMAVSASALAILLVLAAGIWYVRRGRTLAELVDETPDLHPRIAYAIGCLRHELLKHRLGAIGDAVAALRTGGLSPLQLGYLRDRLYGGDSLARLWTIYIDTFGRLGGRRLNLRYRDREFRRARSALDSLERLRSRFESPDPQLAERLELQRQHIATFDRHLREIGNRLNRSRVDGQLLREAVFSVQGEARAAAVHVDEIRFEEPPEDLFVDVYRADLLIILRNLVRNAIMALERTSDGRRAVGLEVGLRTEPTGDESVLIKVLDTSPEGLTTEEIYARRLEHGLGLVAAAVTRYDGSAFVEPAGPGWTKAVVVRFFRALGENGS
jgi:signal transduction histidine kinase